MIYVGLLIVISGLSLYATHLIDEIKDLKGTIRIYREEIIELRQALMGRSKDVYYSKELDQLVLIDDLEYIGKL